jgi:hypothetical protein
MKIEVTASLEQAAVVVFGVDDTGKPHASAFAESDAVLATKAAALMGMKLLPVQTEAQRTLAAKLPRGRVFASGKGFVPFVKAAIFRDLEAAAPEASVPELAADDRVENKESALADTASVGAAIPTSQTVPQPADWADIQAGAIVLAAAATDEGWYECVVLSLEGEDCLRLRYCDWPNEPIFSARRSQVGLMHPAQTPEPPLALEPTADAA